MGYLLFFVISIAVVWGILEYFEAGIYVTVARGSVVGLGFSGVGFLTKSMAMIFFVWLGIQKLGLDYQIFVPMICFFWFFTHIVEGFVIQHYIQRNVPEWFQRLQIK